MAEKKQVKEQKEKKEKSKKALFDLQTTFSKALSSLDLKDSPSEAERFPLEPFAKL